MNRQKPPFWARKKLTEMTPAEWESLCDGCGRCCVEKLEDEDTGEVFYTDTACKLLDCRTARCTDYANRQQHVPDCLPITPEFLANDRKRGWLPETCAYRLLAEGQPLFDWHPLVSKHPESVKKAGICVTHSLG